MRTADILTPNRILLALAATVLGACATQSAPTPAGEQPVLEFPDTLFGERPRVPEIADIFYLPEARESDFLHFFRSPIRNDLPAHRRVQQYLVEVTEKFDFHNDTFMAAESLEASAGNCLSLAILTTALADLAGVEVGYQLVEGSPVFELRGDVGVRGLHVRSLLYDPSSTTRIGQRNGIKIDYFPDGSERFVDNLSHDEYYALYYSNVAGEALANGNYELAYWYLLESLELAPNNSKALNMMAVAYHRMGDSETAERIYRFGIDWLPEKVSFLRNYRTLLETQERREEAAAIAAMLAKIEEPNPFDWLAAGRNAYTSGHYREAIDLYQRAVDIAPYLHQGYLGLALAHLRIGENRSAERHLERAIEHAQRVDTRSMYQAKLAALTGNRL